MGISSHPVMVFYLDTLIDAIHSLDELVLPFHYMEIDSIVRPMLPNKAQSPDGFNACL
jgi:hypothetical protein